jgi:molecular chaperone DnaK (HSP70)
MSVVGIDLGAQTTKIGVARNKGIDIVRVPHDPDAESRSFSRIVNS